MAEPHSTRRKTKSSRLRSVDHRRREQRPEKRRRSATLRGSPRYRSKAATRLYRSTQLVSQLREVSRLLTAVYSTCVTAELALQGQNDRSRSGHPRHAADACFRAGKLPSADAGFAGRRIGRPGAGSTPIRLMPAQPLRHLHGACIEEAATRSANIESETDQADGATEGETQIEFRSGSGIGVAQGCEGGTAGRAHARHADLCVGERPCGGKEAVIDA
jgi:hypothetical protein